MSIDKFKKALTKANVHQGFSEITEWLSLPCLSMNYAITGSYTRAIPNRRTTAIAGVSGAGKSLQIGHLIKQVQDKGYLPIYIDTEGATDKEFLVRLGVDVSEENFVVIAASTIEECTEIMSEAFQNFQPEDKLAFFLDSASGLMTEKESESFDKKKELANDMGLFAKKLKQFVKTINNKMLPRDWFFVYTLHVYENQDLTNGMGRYIVAGGRSQMFIPSIGIMMTKLKLKEGSDAVGIKVNMEVIKTRYYQTGLQTRVDLPWETGFDKYDGLIDIFKRRNLVNQAGSWYNFVDPDTGEVVKFQEKNIDQYADRIIEIEERNYVLSEMDNDVTKSEAEKDDAEI